MVPIAENFGHDAFHIVQVLFRFQGVVHTVVALFIKFSVRDIGVVTKMRAAGCLNQAVGHQRAGGDDCVHDAAIDQFGNHQALLGDGHCARQSHNDKAVFVTCHRLKHVGGFAELAAGECGFRHRPHQIVNGMHSSEVERLQWNEPVLDGIVQLAVNAGAVMAVLIHGVPRGRCEELLYLNSVG